MRLILALVVVLAIMPASHSRQQKSGIADSPRRPVHTFQSLRVIPLPASSVLQFSHTGSQLVQ